MKPPHVLPRTPQVHADWARRHPMERQYVGRSVALSVALHVLLGAAIGVLALLLDEVSFSHAHSIAQSGPAPEQAMTLNLVMAEPPPPALPTPPVLKPAPEPGLPVLPAVQQFPKPPMVVTLVPPPKPPEVKPATPPTPVKTTAKPNNKPRPRYTAANATGEGKTPDVSSEQLAKLGYPEPNYPPEAQAMHQTGTVLMEVGFGPDGRVAIARVFRSSGFSILDISTRSFIRIHWRDLGRANTTIHVPILYTLK